MNKIESNSIDSYTILKPLGEGQFAKTQLVESKDHSNIVAKISKSSQQKLQRDELECFKKESNLTQLKHQNLVQTFNSERDGVQKRCLGKKLRPQITMEQCSHGDLFSLLQNKGAFTENTSKLICYQLLTGLKQLQSKGLSHLDLKPENILVSEDFTVKICDQGFMSQIDKQSQCYKVGTLSYCSPQISESKDQDTELADIFSVGATMITVLLRNPFFTSTDYKIDNNFDQLIKKDKLRAYLLKHKPHLSKDCVDFISKLTQYQESKRANLDTIFKHPWFHNVEIYQQDYYDEFISKTNGKSNYDSNKSNQNST